MSLICHLHIILPFGNAQIFLPILQWTIFTIIVALFFKCGLAGDYNFNPAAFKFETCIYHTYSSGYHENLLIQSLWRKPIFEHTQLPKKSS